MNQPRQINFTISHDDGRNYNCYRTVYGTTVLRQTITVVGRNSKRDPAKYGRHGHPISTMEGIAELIAVEILNGRL